MTVRPFGSARGEHYRYDGKITVGWQASWGPSFSATDSYASDWYVKPDPNKGPYRDKGFLRPKGYFRVAARCSINRPRIHIDTYPDGATVTYRIKLDGNLNPRTPPTLEGAVFSAVGGARTKALLKLKNGNSIELANDLVEARRTINMVAGPVIAVASAYKAAKNGRWNDVPRHLGVQRLRQSPSRTAADKWLEYQFGWLPLLGEIHNGTEMLREGFLSSASSPIARVVGTHSESYDWHNPSSSNEALQLSGTITARCGLYYGASDALLRALDDTGLLNPFAIAWEAVPFSFVVDWFVPVGNTLSAITATAGLRFVAGWESERHDKTEKVYMRKLDPHPNPDMRTTLIDPGLYQSESSYMFRNVLNSFPLPGLYAAPKPFSTKRVSLALALLRQMF